MVGLSGGGDSVALLLLLRELGLELAAAHLDHRMRPDSRRDREFCERLCGELQVPFRADAVNVPELAAAEGISLEAAGRKARYGFLARARGDRLVATAHTLDDQAETVLLRAVEGCGPGGLAAIRPRYEDWVIRPLLGFRRSDLRQYLKVQGQAWLEDPSNRSLSQPRARIRHVVLPELEALNPRVAEALARLAQTTLEDHAYLESRAQLFLGGQPAGSLEVAGLLALPAPIRRRAWLLACRRAAPRPCRLERHHLEQLEDLLRGPAGRWRPLPGGLRVERARDTLQVQPDRAAALPRPAVIPVQDGTWRAAGWGLELQLRTRPGPPAGVQSRWKAFLDRQRLGDRLHLRSRRPGDRIRPVGGAGGKKLKKLLQEAGVPRWQRESVPVLVDDRDTIVWVVGVRVDERFAAGPLSDTVLEMTAQARPSED